MHTYLGSYGILILVKPPIHYIVFATPHKKKYLLQKRQFVMNCLFSLDETIMWAARQMSLTSIFSCFALPDTYGFLRVSRSRNPENIRNPLIFLRKMAAFSCFAGPIDIKIHASMYFMSICPLAHNITERSLI